MLIDESTMLDRYMLEALDRTLRDLLDNEKPFGGKIVILAGDFRQCLPVVPGASRPETVHHCINQSSLWSHFKIMKLSVNMRIHASGGRNLQEFDDWSLSIGNGEAKSIRLPEKYITVQIRTNSVSDTNSEARAMQDFCDQVFPDIGHNIDNPRWLEGRALLATTNKVISSIGFGFVRHSLNKNELSRQGITLENLLGNFLFSFILSISSCSSIKSEQ